MRVVVVWRYLILFVALLVVLSFPIALIEAALGLFKDDNIGFITNVVVGVALGSVIQLVMYILGIHFLEVVEE